MKTSHPDLNNKTEYLKWKENKLKLYPAQIKTIEIKNPYSISSIEKKELLSNIKKYNIAFYKINNSQNNNKDIIHTIAMQFNLQSSKEILSSITKKEDKREYIPYTDQALNWHTDGYYVKNNILSFIIHCERQALNGGESQFFDNDIAYILLREQNINYIKTLMEKDVMCIPANIKNEITIRKEISSPVFNIIDNQLHMRYTERKVNIKWKENPTLKESLQYLKEILKTSNYIMNKKLEEGEGLICNNILHKREAFINNGEKKRLIHRLRFVSRVE